MSEEKKDINAEEKQEESAAAEVKEAAPEEKAPEEAVTEEKAAPEAEEPQEGSAKPRWVKQTAEQAAESAYGDQQEGVEKVIKIGRVSKVVKGGKNFSFNAVVVTGDGKGHVGMGMGKANEVVEAIKKGSKKAKANTISVALRDDTIPHEIIGNFKSTQVIMKPAGPGTGVIAGGPVRALCDAARIKNILTKSLGSRNPINVVRATLDGFERLRLERRKGAEKAE